MKKFLLATLFSCFFCLSLLHAENIFKVVELTEDYVLLNLTIEDFNFLPDGSTEVLPNSNQGAYLTNLFPQTIEIPGLNYTPISVPGKPQLPYFTKVVGLPPEGDLTAVVVSEKYITIKDKYILCNPEYLSPENPSEQGEIIYNEDPAIYKSDSYFPQKLYETNILGYSGDRYLGAVRIFPVQFNPVQKTVKIFTELTVRVNISGNKKKLFGAGGTSPLESVADELIINNQFSQYWEKEREPYPSAKNWSLQDENTINKLKFYIEEEGLYKITYSYLKDTLQFWQDSLGSAYQFDFDIERIDPRYLEVSNKGEPIPIYFYGEEDGSFDPGDYFEFYADINHGETCYYDHYSQRNCYWVEIKETPGARMAVEDCGLYETDPREYRVPLFFDTHIHLEKQNLFTKLKDVDSVREDLWFWNKISSPYIQNFSFTLHDPEPVNLTEYRATVSVALFGYSDTWHQVTAHINSAYIGEITDNWSGQTEKILTNKITNERLNNGENTLYISMPGGNNETVDEILLDYIDITYWRKYVAHNNMLEFNKPSNHPADLYQFAITGFQSSDIDVYKIGRSKLEHVSIESTMPGGGPPFTLMLQDEVFDDDTRYIALSEERKLLPESVIPDIPSNLHHPSQQADYILISTRDFLTDESIPEFITHWQIYGNLNIIHIAVEDIYDEFGYGLRSAWAIRDFLQYAYNNWQPPSPRYVLLLGDGSMEERDFHPYKKDNIIPTFATWSYDVGATVDDNYFACIVGDDELPDLVIGRIPVWEKEQIAPVLAKTIQYNTEQNFEDLWRNHIVLIAGGLGTFESQIFESQNERLNRRYIPEDYRVSRVYVQNPTNPYWGSTLQLKNYINEGAAFIQFRGHGGGQVWADLNLFDFGDVPTLFNDNYPIISSLTCYTSDFGNYRTGCLGEAFILEPDKGAIGFFGGAGKGFLVYDEYLAEFMLNNLFNREMRNVAEAATISKIEYFAAGLYQSSTYLRSFNYLGDPAINIAFPKEHNILNVELNSHEFIVGDTVHIYIDGDETTTFNRVAYYVTDENDLIQDPYQDRKKQVEYRDITRTNYTPDGYDYVIDPTHTDSVFTGIVRCYAYNDTADFIGYTTFAGGQSAIYDIATEPIITKVGDSVYVSANVLDKDGIASVQCSWWRDDGAGDIIPMQPLDNTLFQTAEAIPPVLPPIYTTIDTVFYQIEVQDSTGEVTQSEELFYPILGPDLDILSCEFAVQDNNPSFKVELRNKGQLASPVTELVITYNDTVVATSTIEALDPAETRATFIECSLPPGTYPLTVEVNPDTTFYEIQHTNNVKNKTLSLNYFLVSPDLPSTHTSLDSNLVVTFPAGIVTAPSYWAITKHTDSIGVIPPDTEPVTLQSEEHARYEIALFDTTQLYDNNTLRKNLEVKFNYSASDTLETRGNFAIYRYSQDYKHWFRTGGDMNIETNTVTYSFVDKPGIYSLLCNEDFTPPKIDINVEEQEFTNGDYVDDNATFSFLIQDSNGINPSSLTMFFNGDSITTYSLSLKDLAAISVKHQIDAEAGSHALIISATDANGNYIEEAVNFAVQKDFKILNIGNYPNPVSSDVIDPNNEGRTRFTYTLTDDADEVKIEIYTVSGRLVNTLNNLPSTVGYHEYPRTIKGWECVDKDGRKLANGVYFYKIIATKGKHKIEKIEKLAILR